MLLLLLSRFSHVRLCAAPWAAAYQAPPSTGFSRQEYWSGLPLPSPPLHYSKNTVSQIYFEFKSLPCKGIIIFGTSEQKTVVLKARRMTTQPGFGSEVSWIQSI